MKRGIEREREGERETQRGRGGVGKRERKKEKKWASERRRGERERNRKMREERGRKIDELVCYENQFIGISTYLIIFVVSEQDYNNQSICKNNK